MLTTCSAGRRTPIIRLSDLEVIEPVRPNQGLPREGRFFLCKLRTFKTRGTATGGYPSAVDGSS